MKALIRRGLRLLRRPAPLHHGWQDFELGTYVTDPAPAAVVVEPGLQITILDATNIIGLGRTWAIPAGDTGDQWKPLPAAAGLPEHEYQRIGKKVAVRRALNLPRIELYNALPEMPDLLPWQEALLRDRGWLVRDEMLRAHRRPEDARITICGDPAPEHVGLQVWGIPVCLEPDLPVDQMHVEFRDRFPRIRAVHTPLPDGGWSIEEVNEDAAQMIADHRRWHP